MLSLQIKKCNHSSFFIFEFNSTELLYSLYHFHKLSISRNVIFIEFLVIYCTDVTPKPKIFPYFDNLHFKDKYIFIKSLSNLSYF